MGGGEPPPLIFCFTWNQKEMASEEGGGLISLEILELLDLLDMSLYFMQNPKKSIGFFGFSLYSMQNYKNYMIFATRITK